MDSLQLRLGIFTGLGDWSNGGSRMTMDWRFFVTGTQIHVRTEDPLMLAVGHRLASDFAAFSHLPPEGAPDRGLVQIELRSGAPQEPTGVIFRWRGSRFTGAGNTRSVWYDRRARVDLSGSARSRCVRIIASEADLAHELGFNFVLSAVGELLDLRGGHRVHALGFRHRASGRTGLILAESGVGKSTLANQMLESSDFDLYSDESPWLRNTFGRIWIEPFPLRLAGTNGAQSEASARIVRRDGAVKLLRAFPKDRIATSAPLDWILLGTRDGIASPFIQAASWGARIQAVLLQWVVGWGYAQIGENLLRVGPGSSLPRVLANRIRNGPALLRLPFYTFELGEDPRLALRALSAFCSAVDRGALEFRHSPERSFPLR